MGRDRTDREDDPRRSRRRSRGQSMVEYAIILVLVAVLCIGVMTSMGNQVSLTFQDIQAYLQNPTDAGGTSPYTCPDGTTSVLHGHKYHCQ
jgi:Flp pilus assembly pilin Flp